MNAADNDFFDFANTSNRRSFTLLAIGAIAGLVIAGYGLFTAAGTATRTVPPEYVALVNQRPIYRSDYIAQLQATFTVTLDEATAEQKQQVLNDMIDEELLVQRGLEADLPSYDPDVRTALVAGVELQLYASVLARQPSDDELKAYYQAHAAKYSSLGMMRLRDLMVKFVSNEKPEAMQQRAADAVAALRAGNNLDSVMSQFQLIDSPRLLFNGKPDLEDIFEFAVAAKLPPAVYAASKKLQAGTVSDPINVKDEGTHIIVMNSRRQSQPLDFAAVRASVWTDLKAGEQNKVRASTLAYLRGKSEILTAKE